MRHFSRVSCLSLFFGVFFAGAVFAKPVQHIVFFKFTDNAKPQQIEAVLRGFEELPEKIPGIVGFQWGTDNSPEGLQKGFTHAWMVTFKDAAARDAYLPHEAHQDFLKIALPIIEKVHVFDFDLDKVGKPMAPGRVHHLVFFKFKEGSDVQKIVDAFGSLDKKIPGLLAYSAGTNNFPDVSKANGFTHAFQVTFINADARDDYLPHPAHKEFVKLVGPTLDDVLVIDFTVRPSGRTLLVTEGLEPYRVYQRGKYNKADLSFKGLAAGNGPIQARILKGRRTVPGFDWKTVGKAAAGKFEAKISGVPAGGEYTVEVRRLDSLGNIAEITDVANLLVGDIWILAGQSNMQGVGDLIDVEEPHPLVHNFTMAHRWELATEPLHWLIDSRDPVHLRGRMKGLDEEGRRKRRAQERQRRTKGTGLGLAFAKEMVKQTGVPVGLISAAHGGTSMTQWDPAKKDQGGASLYGSMLKQAKRAGGNVKGVLWYQGESDANSGAAPLYRERFQGLIKAFRKDFNQPKLPFYYVQIGRFVIQGRDVMAWKKVQEEQRTLAGSIPNTAVISVMDLQLDDLIHVGTQGLKRAGKRLAHVARKKLFGEKDLKLGPQLQSVSLGSNRVSVHVKFNEVNGKLSPSGNIAGFSILNADGKPLNLIYDASVSKDHDHTVILKLRNPIPKGASVWYGAGLNPICNLVDSADMAAPAFGPITVK